MDAKQKRDEKERKKLELENQRDIRRRNSNVSSSLRPLTSTSTKEKLPNPSTFVTSARSSVISRPSETLTSKERQELDSERLALLDFLKRSSSDPVLTQSNTNQPLSSSPSKSSPTLPSSPKLSPKSTHSPSLVSSESGSSRTIEESSTTEEHAPKVRNIVNRLEMQRMSTIVSSTGMKIHSTPFQKNNNNNNIPSLQTLEMPLQQSTTVTTVQSVVRQQTSDQKTVPKKQRPKSTPPSPIPKHVKPLFGSSVKIASTILQQKQQQQSQQQQPQQKQQQQQSVKATSDFGVKEKDSGSLFKK